MKTHNRVFWSLSIAQFATVFLAQPSHAQFFEIEFVDPVGSQWTGFLNTIDDIVFLRTWTENPGGTDFWPLQETAVVALLARDANNGFFDIPRTIDYTWGFAGQRLDAHCMCTKELRNKHYETLGQRYGKSMSLEPIASQLGQKAGTVGTTLFCIRKSLANCIERRLKQVGVS